MTWALKFQGRKATSSPRSHCIEVAAELLASDSYDCFRNSPTFIAVIPQPPPCSCSAPTLARWRIDGGGSSSYGKA